MLQATVARLDGVPAADPMLICNEEHRFRTAEQLGQVGKENGGIILEPMGPTRRPPSRWRL